MDSNDIKEVLKVLEMFEGENLHQILKPFAMFGLKMAVKEILEKIAAKSKKMEPNTAKEEG